LFDVERDHNAHMVRMMLGDIFDHGIDLTYLPAIGRTAAAGGKAAN
jgi:hypothetical protein